jgi:carbohydrate-selective porin OprB
MSYPQATDTGNHGLAFQGFGPDPSQNGLFAIGEIGVTPKIGASKLSGKYAFGGFYYEQQNTSFFGTPYPGFYGFYWQVDQDGPLARGAGSSRDGSRNGIWIPRQRLEAKTFRNCNEIFKDYHQRPLSAIRAVGLGGLEYFQCIGVKPRDVIGFGRCLCEHNVKSRGTRKGNPKSGCESD